MPDSRLSTGILPAVSAGQAYENRSFRYFLQIHECPRKNRTKVKVSRWIDTPDVKAYEEFAARWHYFLKDTGECLGRRRDQALSKKVCMAVLERTLR